MVATTLWRLDGGDAEGPLARAQLEDGLRLHLRHTDLLTVAVRIGSVQRQYIALGGCGACAGPNTLQRCAPGCPVELLRRLLRVVWPACMLTAVSRGLAPRAYTRLLWLAPTADTAPLESDVLTPWDEARLTLHWRSGPKGLQVAGLLAVGPDGPPPAEVFVARGWRARALPAAVSRLAPLPKRIPFPTRWPHAPILPLLQPAEKVTEAPPDQPQAGSELVGTERLALANALALRLTPLLELSESTASAWMPPDPDQPEPGEAFSPLASSIEEPDPADSLWPPGPGAMRPSDVALLIEQIRTSPIVRTASEPGVTRKRLAQLLPPGQSEYARQLVCWLDRAGLLSEPPVPDDPFRNPRPLLDADDTELAAKLTTTAIPSPEEAHALMRG